MHPDSYDSDLTSEALPRLIFADDHRMVAEGITRLLDGRFDLAGMAQDGHSLLAQVRREEPDLVLSDINMPGRSGLDVLKVLGSEGNPVPFVIVPMHSEPALAATAMRAGANGYVLKLSAGEELLMALEHVLAGRTYVTPSLAVRYLRGHLNDVYDLTPKQREVLRLVGAGMRSKQIASQLGLSVRTVEAHKYTVMQILDVHSTVELVRRSEELGLFF